MAREEMMSLWWWVSPAILLALWENYFREHVLKAALLLRVSEQFLQTAPKAVT